jgi:hypothetical protein
MGNENSQAITFFPVKQKGGHQKNFGVIFVLRGDLHLLFIKYDPNKHHRRLIGIKGYDYTKLWGIFRHYLYLATSKFIWCDR